MVRPEEISEGVGGGGGRYDTKTEGLRIGGGGQRQSEQEDAGGRRIASAGCDVIISEVAAQAPLIEASLMIRLCLRSFKHRVQCQNACPF